MLQNEYLIDVFLGDERLGSGLRFMRKFALTAAHRLGDSLRGSRRRNGLRLGDGTPVVVADYNLTSDLALLRLLPDDSDVPLPRVRFDTAKREEPWRTAYQLADRSKSLYGHVADADAVYRRTESLVVKALRLQVDSSPEGHSDYAGSPIERTRQSGPPVALGLLVEPRPHRDTEGIASFAGTVSEAVRLFKHHLGAAPTPGGQEGGSAAHDFGDEGAKEYPTGKNAIERHLDKAGLINIVRVDWTQ
ncbi:hypothetical protein ACIP79_27780 [Streptomyces sp. NPDC088747]|uniref:hypothetical protein n=1 Tax=Streptomyces sp. NPDC088747 TaxID=3365886 RepID=UPI0038304C31